MKFIAKLLSLFGANGKTLDKAIKLMTELDTYLEQVEAIEKAKATEAEAQISVLNDVVDSATDNAARAARIRERAKEFVA